MRCFVDDLPYLPESMAQLIVFRPNSCWRPNILFKDVFDFMVQCCARDAKNNQICDPVILWSDIMFATSPLRIVNQVRVNRQ